MRKLSWLALLVALALVAAACGGDDDAAQTAEPAATDTTVAEAMDDGDDMEDDGTDDAMGEVGDIVTVATEAGSFSTLLTAVEAAGLVDTLQGEGPFTVFAPTDAAFAALPEGTLDGLLADTDALTDVLLYHVVSGKVLAEDVVGLSTATTVQESDIAISVDGESVLLNEVVQVVSTDVVASNGVIHVIDAVLLPPAN